MRAHVRGRKRVASYDIENERSFYSNVRRRQRKGVCRSESGLTDVTLPEKGAGNKYSTVPEERTNLSDGERIT